MTVHHTGHGVTLHHGDALDVLRELPDNSVDAVVTDPPYGLGFMGKDWDDAAALASRPPSAEMHDNAYPRTGKGPAAVAFDGLAFQQWCSLWAAECLRVLKPGGHLLAFGGTRTSHRLACAIEDAGFEIRDSIAWLYGSGFPKSLDVGKAIDKAAGATREVVGVDARYLGMSDRAKRELGAVVHEGTGGTGFSGDPSQVTAPATPEAAQWAGWGTALKPAHEPIVVARKPLAGTVANNVLTHGTGALNIDGCRIGTSVETWPQSRARPNNSRDMHHDYTGSGSTTVATGDVPAGRWPANVVLDDHAAAELDTQSGDLHSGANPTRRGSDKFRDAYGDFAGQDDCDPARGADSGGASRFFYTAKADATERPRVAGTSHPTVKPLDLMRWLVRLVTPPGGIVLEPFAGSGTTVEAALLEGMQCIAIEREADYLPLILSRLHRQRDPVAFVKLAGDPAELTLFDEEPPA